MFKRHPSHNGNTDSSKTGLVEPLNTTTMRSQVPPRVFEKPKIAPVAPYTSPQSSKSPERTLPYSQIHLEREEPDTTLGEGVVFKGELTFRRLLRIDGHFEGELVSDGKLIVGPTGVVKSNIRMNEAIIEGRVEGNVTVTNRLELRREAEVIGDIKAALLSVDEGVSIIGHIAVVPKKNVPMIEKSCN